MALIYHITTEDAWEKAAGQGFYETPSLQDEGFIHCTHAHQTQLVLEKYFKGVKDVVILTIDTEKLDVLLIEDWSPTLQDHFPHIYGYLFPGAVVAIKRA